MAVLSEGQRAQAIGLLSAVREGIDVAADGDEAIRFQMRRYIAKRLEFDERGTPTQRRKLKRLKSTYQKGLCALCAEKLPQRGAELHRLRAIDGYTPANTLLLCNPCHRRAQESDVTGIPLESA